MKRHNLGLHPTAYNMTNEKHKSKLISLIDELMAEIDLKPLHPKNKILLYSRYVLLKQSWHFTVATISKTWVVENIDSPVNKYISQIHSVSNSSTQCPKNISKRFNKRTVEVN